MFELTTMPIEAVPAYMATLAVLKQAAPVAEPNAPAKPRARNTGLARRLRNGGAMRIARVAMLTLRHHAALAPFRTAPRDSLLGRVLADRTEIRGMVLTPYVCADWDAPTRLARVVEHCAIAEDLGRCFALTSRDYVELIELPQIGEGFRVTLDSPRWMTRDGLLTISMWHGVDRIFSLSFSLARENGALIGYVGGVQGQRGQGTLDLYRNFTKAAHGMRPRDMIIELFRMLAVAIGVTGIRCVEDRNRYQRSAYTLAQTGNDPVELDYDAIWNDRGAMRRKDGFFDLALDPARRAVEDIPANKRSLYRKRYAMLDEVQAIMTAVMHARAGLVVRQHG